MWGSDSWGHMIWSGTGATPVPGLGEWGVLLPLLMALLGFGLLARRRGHRLLSLTLMGVVIPFTAVAAMISLPNSFVNGTTADADEVNANFAAIVSEVNARDAVLDALVAADLNDISSGFGLLGGGTVGSLTLDVDPTVVQRCVTGSCPSGQSIRSIDSLGAVVCEADDVGLGDITEVTAGSGLSGGGTSGSVALAVGTAGILASHLSPDSVGSTAVADGTLTDGDLATSSIGSGTVSPVLGAVSKVSSSMAAPDPLVEIPLPPAITKPGR